MRSKVWEICAVANIFPLARIVAAIFVVRDILSHDYAIAIAIFAAAETSDLLGRLMKWMLQDETQFSARFDTVADKVLLNGTLLSLSSVDMVPQMFALIIFARDASVIVGAVITDLTSAIHEFLPSSLGRVAMFVQALTAAAYLARAAAPGIISVKTAVILLCAAVACTIFNLFEYGWRWLQEYPDKVS